MAETNHDAKIKAAIDALAKTINGHANPEHIVFVHEKVEDKSWGPIEKVPGLVAGVAIGGPMGEMVFGNTLLSENAKFKGTLKLLVLHGKQISIGTFEDTPFLAETGNITPEHLQLMRSRSESESFVQESYEIPCAEVSAPGGDATINGDKIIGFEKSELFVEEKIYETSDLKGISEQIRGAVGELTSPQEFLDKLRAGENTTLKLLSGETILSDTQAKAAIGNDSFIASLVEELADDEERDLLLKNVRKLPSPLTEAIERQLQVKADSQFKSLAWFFFWTIIGFFAVTFTVGMTADGEIILAIIAGILSLASILGIWVCWTDFGNAGWCRSVLENRQRS